MYSAQEQQEAVAAGFWVSSKKHKARMDKDVDEGLLPRMYKSTVAIAPLLLMTPLFSVARAGAGVLEGEEWTAKGRGTVHYTGPRLTQSHLSVLLTLVKGRSGQRIDNIYRFKPSALLAEMGWSDNPRNVQRVKDMLSDMYKADLDIETKEMELHARILSAFKIDKATGAIEVELSKTLLPLWKGNLTYLDIEERKALREGLATFLHGVVAANNCNAPFKVEALAEASGSSGQLRVFRKNLLGALETLKAAGIIAGYKAGAGEVRISK